MNEKKEDFKMNNIIKRETEGRVIEMVVDAAYVPLFKELREMGYRIPDLSFMFTIFPNEIFKEFAEIYVNFENYGEQHFIVGVGNPDNGEEFIDFLKSVALTDVYNYEFSQRELLEDLDEAELIFEELGWDSLDEDYESDCYCDEENTDETLVAEGIVEIQEGKTLNLMLEPMCFPCFASLVSAGFEIPEILCRVEFKNDHSDKSIGTCIKFSYKFEGYGDYVLIRSMPAAYLNEELSFSQLKSFAYNLVEDVPAFYHHLIKNLPHAGHIVEKMEKTREIFASVTSTLKLNIF